MRHRLLKSLRITVTAVSLLVCGLLIVLWVRSCWRVEGARGRLSTYLVDIVSLDQNVTIRTEFQPNAVAKEQEEWNVFSVELERDFRHGAKPSWILQLFPRRSYYRVIRIPYWFLVTMFITTTATIAALSWIKWHFSLRTLLIVLTLIAVFFGAIAMSL